MSNGGETTRKEIVNKVYMSASWKIPRQLHASIPTSEELSCLLPIKVPQHASVKVTAVDLNSIEDLLLISKAEGLPDGCAVVNEHSPLALAVVVHVSILMQLMPKVSGTVDPGKILSIQLEGCWLPYIS